MQIINIHEAKTHLSRIIERVAAGESVIIGKAGKPLAVLSPYASSQKPRKPGRLKGRIEFAAGFDDADEQIADLFEGDSAEGSAP